MRRRPLLRAAAIAGGAYCAGKRRLNPDERLSQLRKLLEQGVLTDEEFAQQKAQLVVKRSI